MYQKILLKEVFILQKELNFSNTTYTINMKVSLIPVAPNWLAYKRIKNIKDTNKEKIECGLCKDVDLDKLTTDPFFIPSAMDGNKKVFLARRQFLEDYRYNAVANKNKDLFPENLYTALKLELPENFVLLREDKNALYFNLTDGKKVARETKFSLQTYAVTEKEYDLEKILEIILKRTDIYIPYAEDKIKISSGVKHLDFSWIPNDEDWDNYINAISGNIQNEYKYILDEILQLPKLTVSEKYDKIIRNMANYINHTDIDEDICKKTKCPLNQYEENDKVCIECIIKHFS